MDAAVAMTVLEKRRKDIAEKLTDQVCFIGHIRSEMLPNAEKRRAELEEELGAIDRAQDALRRDPQDELVAKLQVAANG